MKSGGIISDIKLRVLTEEDCNLLFLWVNDKDVRRNAFNTNIITYDEHKNWFKKVLTSNQCIIYIALLQEQAIGQIRIDIENNIGIIDYSIAQEFRGKGYGALLLTAVYNKMQEDYVEIIKLIGRVKLSNIASQKSFEKANYVPVKKDDYIEYSYEF